VYLAEAWSVTEIAFTSLRVEVGAALDLVLHLIKNRPR